MPDPSISDDDVLRVTRSFLERMDRQPPPRDIEGDVMKVILTPRRTRWIPSARLVASGLMVAAVVAVGCVALVLPVDRLSSPSPSTAGASPHWSIVPSPTPSGTPYGQLVNVACPSASDCWAVGDLEKGRNDVSLLERYTDGGWSIVASPIPSGATSSGLGGVTCMGAVDCWAVGSYTGAGGHSQTLVEQDKGDGWSIVPSPNPTGAANETPYNPEGGALIGVTRVNASDCWAVGSPTGPTGGATALIEQNTGYGWHIISSPVTPGGRTASGVLNGVTCVSASDCWAVGFYPDAGGRRTLVEQYTGTGWSIVSSSNAEGAFSTLMGMTCASAGDCLAVGFDGNPGTATKNGTLKNGTLIEQDDHAAG